REPHRFGKRPIASDAATDRAAAQVTPPGTAIAAEAAGDLPFSRDAVADVEAAHFLTHLDDLTDVFVTDLHRHRNRLRRPIIPFPNVDIGAADRGLANADQDTVMAHFGFLAPRERP